MEFNILIFSAFLSVAIVVSHAASPSEEYWNSVLPNTPMPKALKVLVQPTPEYLEDKSTTVGVTDSGSPFLYRYAATETQLHDDPTVALFFLEKDLFTGNKMNLHFTKPTNHKIFLPHSAAVRECEDAGIEGEERFCPTSLESMVDFITSVLGSDVSAVSTKADSAEKKVYRIEAVARMPTDKAVVACHKLEYAYAVFYCHKTDATVAYGVTLVGAGGAKAEAVALCHRDTSGWNPEHLAFRVLGVKPGAVPVCHYLPENHIVWVSKNN